MADGENGSRGRGLLGFLLLLIALVLLWWIFWPPWDDVPDLERPMVADLTGFDQGDPARPYPIGVFINTDGQGAIVMTYRGQQYSNRFGYAVRPSEPEQVVVAFQVQLYGTDQMPPGEWYFLALNSGGGATLQWHQRNAQGAWRFDD